MERTDPLIKYLIKEAQKRKMQPWRFATELVDLWERERRATIAWARTPGPLGPSVLGVDNPPSDKQVGGRVTNRRWKKGLTAEVGGCA